MSVKIIWTIPSEYAADITWDKIRIYRSDTEQSGYVLLDTINSNTPNYVTEYTDVSAGADRSKYYLIRLYKTATNTESKFFLTLFELTPRELRLVNQLRDMLGTVVTTDPTTLTSMSDEALASGIKLALGYFNAYPPPTTFTIDNFPYDYEMLLLYAAQIMTLLNKYLGLSITDFNYNDNGLSLNLDRGAKVNQAIQNSTAWLNSLFALAKLEFAPMGMGVGTLQLPISMGGQLSRGISNILDIFASAGR